MMQIRRVVLALALSLTFPAIAGELFPFTLPLDVRADGSITDLSSWNDKPAGARGFVTVDGSHLTVGGKRLRFLGVNIVFGSTAPTHADADAIARRLARFGINLVRFHLMDARPTPDGILQRDLRTLDPDTLDRVDYFIAALAREGIYADLNLHVGRQYPGMGEIWADGPKYWKGVDLFYPPMFVQQQEYARVLLTHRNPYTGHRYTDEPAVAFVEINNEDGLIREWRSGSLDMMPAPFRTELARQWRVWLEHRYADDDALRAGWGVREEPYGAEMLSERIASKSSDPGWVLQTLGGASATLAATDSGLMLSMTTPGQLGWHTQLHYNHLSFQTRHAYTLSLRLRADHPLTLSVQAMQAHAPWQTLWSQKIPVGTDWQDVTVTFMPQQDDATARLTLGGLGLDTGHLDIAHVRLRSGGLLGLQPDESLTRGTLDVIPFASRLNRTVAAQRDWLSFLWDTEAQYWRNMRDFLKGELGVRSPVIGTQVSYSPAAIQQALDVVDGHAYWQHPRFPGKPWDRNNWFIGNSPMAGIPGGGTLADLALHRVPGKPFIVSEYNHPAPSLWQGEAMPLAAAYGALQDWDGIAVYNYGASKRNWQADFITDYFDSVANPVKMSSLVAAAALLRREDVRADKPQPQPMPDRTVFIDALRQGGRLPGADSLGAPRDAALAEWVSIATPACEPPSWPVRSRTGQLIWGVDGIGGKTVVVDTPRSKGLIGARLGQVYDAHGVGLEVTAARNDWGVLLATVLDGQSFTAPSRILLTTLGQEENTGQHWLDAAKTTIGSQFGTGPVLVEGIGARITLPVAPSRVSAWALDARGQRQTPIPVGGTQHAILNVDERYRTLWYEIDIR
ncbi:carbohydrate binding domain-containing protein [Dickeya sp. Secpp 1600]|uniref:carbohydrate binding domain-containing protein n=1 Tax=Dickeya sp. Secpp 1600 TaxID=2037915 RepID=UPI000D311FA9|nr:carbohydrate binding domain-containing protein [Dickeya sp. Secpp 1600]